MRCRFPLYIKLLWRIIRCISAYICLVDIVGVNLPVYIRRGRLGYFGIVRIVGLDRQLDVDVIDSEITTAICYMSTGSRRMEEERKKHETERRKK